MSETKEEKCGWTEEVERDIKYIGDCSRAYLWMYRADIRKYSQYHRILSNLVMLLAVLGPGLVALGVGLGEEKVLATFGIVISFLVGVGEGVIRNFEFETKVADLRRQAGKFSGLVNNIRRQLSSLPEARENASSYSIWIAKNYDDLVDSAIEISESTFILYEKTAKDKNLPVPDSLSELTEIHVHSPKRSITRASTRPLKKETSPERDLTGSPTGSSAGDLISEGLKFTDERMKYELERLGAH